MPACRAGWPLYIGRFQRILKEGIGMSIAFVLKALTAAISGNSFKAEPDDLNYELKKAQQRAVKRIIRARNRAQFDIGELDRARVKVMSDSLKRFSEEFGKIIKIDFADCEQLEGLDHFHSEHRDWQKLEELSAKAKGIFVLGNPTAESVIVFGSGILERLAILPPLVVDHKGLSVKDKAAMEDMKVKLAAFQLHVRKICNTMNDIRREAREMQDAILNLADFLDDGIEDIRIISDHAGTDWTSYTETQKLEIGRAAQIAQVLAALCSVHFLNEDGTLMQESRDALNEATDMLREFGI